MWVTQLGQLPELPSFSLPPFIQQRQTPSIGTHFALILSEVWKRSCTLLFLLFCFLSFFSTLSSSPLHPLILLELFLQDSENFLHQSSRKLENETKHISEPVSRETHGSAVSNLSGRTTVLCCLCGTSCDSPHLPSAVLFSGKEAVMILFPTTRLKCSLRLSCKAPSKQPLINFYPAIPMSPLGVATQTQTPHQIIWRKR